MRPVCLCLYTILPHDLIKDKLGNSYIKGWLVVLLFYVHGKYLRSCRDGQLT